jgi:hypothetical protein
MHAEAVAMTEPLLTRSQKEFLDKIRAANGEIRFNMRGKKPLTTLQKLGLIRLDLRNEPCSKRGSRLFYIAEATKS